MIDLKVENTQEILTSNQILNNPDLILKTDCFNLLDTLECGQCFRWQRVDTPTIDRNSSEFIGVISDRVIRIKQRDDHIFVYSNKKEKLKEIICYYFDLYSDYKKIEKEIAKLDNNIKLALKLSTGIHILNQDNFETIVSYIISSNNNIPRIKKSIADISKRYGTHVIFEDNDYYLFPTLKQLEKVTKEEFKECGTGFRDKYLVKTIADLNESNICDEKTTILSNSQLKKILMNFVGIGPKVADCVMLFSFGRQDVFPVDVWVKRVMEKLYFGKEASLRDIEVYASKKFGRYAGIIQQHLFYNVRNDSI